MTERQCPEWWTRPDEWDPVLDRAMVDKGQPVRRRREAQRIAAMRRADGYSDREARIAAYTLFVHHVQRVKR